MPGTYEATQYVASVIIIKVQLTKVGKLTGLPDRRALCKSMHLSDSTQVEKSGYGKRNHNTYIKCYEKTKKVDSWDNFKSSCTWVLSLRQESHSI